MSSTYPDAGRPCRWPDTGLRLALGTAMVLLALALAMAVRALRQNAA